MYGGGGGIMLTFISQQPALFSQKKVGTTSTNGKGTEVFSVTEQFLGSPTFQEHEANIAVELLSVLSNGEKE